MLRYREALRDAAAGSFDAVRAAGRRRRGGWRELARLTAAVSAPPPGDRAAEHSRLLPVFQRIYLVQKKN